MAPWLCSAQRPSGEITNKDSFDPLSEAKECQSYRWNRANRQSLGFREPVGDSWVLWYDCGGSSSGTLAPIRMLQCLQCKSQRVTKGRVENYESHHPAIFRPQGLRTFTFTLAGGTELSEEAYACLDCGLVWSSTAAEKLAAIIQKHCDQTSDTPSA